MTRRHLFFILLITVFSCNNEEEKSELANSPSLYLQQHASDPVDWHIWSNSIWKDAKKQNKLILISIGYSACHWCHVMQHESFKNKDIAEVMNKYFYSIKIDREQNPDIDAYYAEQQQKLTGWAGWPMHIILNSKKVIIWTGIYLKPEKWKQLLLKIALEYKKNPNAKFLNSKIEETKIITNNTINIDSINKVLIRKLDTINGGLKPIRYSRKYPRITLFNYLLQIYIAEKSPILEQFLKTTATKMALGGLNDQIEGGFYRFSMDEHWHIPHFEKMLYTNAQLIDFYANSYIVFGEKLYKSTAINTANFIIKNFNSTTGLFYSSMNADQITEGSYYIYTLPELKSTLKQNFEIAKSYYNINNSWIWHKMYFHLNTIYSDKQFALANNISLKEWLKTKANIQKALLQIRQNRKKPQLDTKLISSWNALLMTAFTEAYAISGKIIYLDKAQKIAKFFQQKFKDENKIRHYYLTNRLSNAETYPEDILYLAKALIQLYNKDFNENHIFFAQTLFEQYLFQKKANEGPPNSDKVMPSIIATENYLAKYFNRAFRTSKYKIINLEKLGIIQNPENFGGQLSFKHLSQTPNFELIITGSKKEILKNTRLRKIYAPNLIYFIKQENSKLPILKDYKYSNKKPVYYLCSNGYCSEPTSIFSFVINNVKKNKVI